LALIILLACALAAGSWRVVFQHWDEPEHLAAGIELLDRGQYEYDTSIRRSGACCWRSGPYSPGRALSGTPPPNGTQEGIDILYSGGHYARYLTLARAGVLAVSRAAAVFATGCGRAVVQVAGAALRLRVCCSSRCRRFRHAALASSMWRRLPLPARRLHPATVGVSARLRDAALFRTRRRPGGGTKFSAVPFIGIGAAGLALVHAALPGGDPPLAGARSRLLALALALHSPHSALALGSRFALVQPGRCLQRVSMGVSYLLQERDWITSSVCCSRICVAAELKDLVNGIVAVKAHNDSGHLSYLAGTRAPYRVVVLPTWWRSRQTPIPAARRGPWAWRGCAGRLAQPRWLGARAGGARGHDAHIRKHLQPHQHRIRHVLMLYPFFALGAAYCDRVLARLAAWRNRRLAAGAGSSDARRWRGS